MLTAGMVTVSSLTTWATVRAVGARPLLAPLLPTATFVALLDSADLPAMPEGRRSRALLAGVAVMPYVASAFNATALT